MIRNIGKRNIYPLLFILCVCFFYFFQIGYLDGLRQGTEGFYLKITDEMFKAGNLLDPIYNGQRHWSKPPLQFWLPQPLFFILGESNIFLSRLSISIFTLVSIYFFSLWIFNQYKIDQLKSYLFFACSLAFFKYGRIFMMEMPLAILSAGSYLALYNYIESDNKKSLLIGSLLLGLSVLVKGPVSLVMVLGSLTLYSFYIYRVKKIIIIKKLLKITILSLLIASPWFIYSTVSYGKEFIDYFFLRENMGKFTSKSYPLRAVFQGLFLYALPWSLYSFQIFKSFRDDIKDPKLVYLLTGFSFFFALWLIPSQRSHHYAIPSIPLFLTYAIIKLDTFQINKLTKVLHLIFVTMLYLFIAIFMFLVQYLIPNTISLFEITVIIICTTFYFYCVIKNKNLYLVSASHLSTVGLIWLILIPSAILPTMPSEVVKTIGNEELTVVVTKPYFISQAINRDVNVEKPGSISSYMENSEALVLMHHKLYTSKSFNKKMHILHKWTIWRRGLKVKQIYKAITSKNLAILQDSLVLLRKK